MVIMILNFNQNLALGLGKFYKMKKLPRNPSHCRSSIIQRMYQPPVLVNLYGLPIRNKMQAPSGIS